MCCARLMAAIAACLLVSTDGLLAVTIDTVPVNNPGNPSFPGLEHGAVGYDYRIGKTEVTFSVSVNGKKLTMGRPLVERLPSGIS